MANLILLSIYIGVCYSCLQPCSEGCFSSPQKEKEVVDLDCEYTDWCFFWPIPAQGCAIPPCAASSRPARCMIGQASDVVHWFCSYFLNASKFPAVFFCCARSCLFLLPFAAQPRPAFGGSKLYMRGVVPFSMKGNSGNMLLWQRNVFFLFGIKCHTCPTSKATETLSCRKQIDFHFEMVNIKKPLSSWRKVLVNWIWPTQREQNSSNKNPRQTKHEQIETDQRTAGQSRPGKELAGQGKHVPSFASEIFLGMCLEAW